MSPDVTPRIIDRFAGPGGWDEGLRMIGRTDVIGIEWDAAACETARANGHARVQADIALLDPEDFVAEHLDGRAPEGGIDSPPCQGFAMSGKGLGRLDTPHVLAAVARIGAGERVDLVLKELRAQCADPRTALVLEPLRWALALRPSWLAWEQAPAVLPLWEACAEILRDAGWSAWTGMLQAEQYGVPQTRKRAVLTASRHRAVGRPAPTHSRFHVRDRTRLDPGVLPWVSMADALGASGPWEMGDVRAANGTVRGIDEPSATLTSSMDNGNFAWRLRSNYGTGGDPAARGMREASEPAPTVTSKIDRNLWQYVNGNQPNSARRPLDTPAPTVHFAARQRVVEWQPVAANDGTTGDGPQQKARGSVRVTVEQAAILQSFPPGYVWRGSRSAQYQQVGNAVPPLLAAHILWSVGADGRPPWVP